MTVRLSITNPDQHSNIAHRSQKALLLSSVLHVSEVDVCDECIIDFCDWSGHERSPVAFGADRSFLEDLVLFL